MKQANHVVEKVTKYAIRKLSVVLDQLLLEHS